MASSNRHWPSMFRSNPACDVQQPDMNNGSGLLLPSPAPAGAGKPSLISSAAACDDQESTRSPEPKPRWNPRPEQIRILEGIFNSGMVNPPRDEIRRIRLQLQEYGQVGDANVFYWFQNRKSRTKNKLRAAGQLPAAAAAGRAALARSCVSPPPPSAHAAPAAAPMTPPRSILAAPAATTDSSSSSSDRSSGSSKSVKLPPATASHSAAAAAAALQGMLPATANDMFLPAPAPALSAAACNLYYSHPMAMAPTPAAPERELVSHESLLLQWPQSQYLPATELGGVLGSHSHPPAMHPALSPGVLLGLCNGTLGQETVDVSCSKGLAGQYLSTTGINTEPMMINNKADAVSTVIREDEKARLGLLHYGFSAAAAALAATPALLAAANDDATPAAVLPSAAPIINLAAGALPTDQLQVQGLLDAGLTGGTAAAPATATVVAVTRDVVMCASTTTQYSVPAMTRLDVKLFGDAAVLLRHTGEPVLVDDAGVTVEPLQRGAVYYVLATN